MNGLPEGITPLQSAARLALQSLRRTGYWASVPQAGRRVSTATAQEGEE
jgi:hypothetical protein